VISDQARIVNYNWGGQGESSVFPNGQAGDASLGNTATEIDWPALTQAQTYFTPGPGSGSNNAKQWLGTFVANGQGTTGMLYRRNRYFDPNSGQFTQADPIGIAGGMNAFGFASGDPVNFSDPFGLCPPWSGCIAQAIANWGAQRGGTLGALALNSGAALNGAFEASGINDAASGGEALGRGDIKAAAGFLALTFGGEAFKGAKLLKNVHGGFATPDEALRGAERWLGEGYQELDKGVFRSKDGIRQFRMTVHDLTDSKKGAHVHFESVGKDGKVIQNAHVYLNPE